MHRRAEQSDDFNGDYHDRPPRSSEDDATESTPLFAGNPPRPGANRGRTDSLLRAANTLHVPKVHNPDLIVGIFCAVVLVGSASGGLWVIPTTRKVEDIVCRHYYDVLSSENIDESLCKEDAIQSKVAYIFAIYSALQASIGAACAFPWGIVADRLGRKWVFSLTILGMSFDQAWFAAVCAFPKTLPLEALWFGPTFLVLGGGNAVLSAIVFSMLADVTTSENRAKSFMRVHLSSMIGNLCAPAVAGWMMEKTGPWPVMAVAYVGFLTLIFTIHLIPETKPAAQVSEDPIEDEDESESPMLGAIQHTLLRLKESFALFKSPSLVLLLVATLSSYPVLLSTLQFMSIYASKRYHVSLSQTGYLSSLYGSGVLLSIILILPAFSKLLASPKMPKTLRIPDDHQRDLFLARVSSIALLMGSLSMSASPTVGSFIGGLAILSLGTGWGSYVRSVSSVFVDPAHRTRLFSIISLVETAGQTYAQPMLAWLFSIGMKMGGLWIGLPYLGVAAFCLLALILLLLVRLPPSEGKTPEDDGESSLPAQP
ncbi:major facilitator superfamily transporter [Colletotrichum karsti]|uniref:Major facilitator superfamily transporter n=1 Tax=Colletotrichum karsti TaxID=1095194 RepID=A0A9P6I4T4_9PEZI|nr:major facilitator superfamily transporter [Colletotrichum karsti]KAF9876942.1 major facilitator superfamily transporter [Colletotrichum karsti]